MKIFEDYFWPDADTITPAVVLNEVKRLPLYLAHVPGRACCVQAGGNVGVYANALAREFAQVITVEPDPENWECLRRNVTTPHVQAHHACLGDAPAGGWETYRPEHETHNFGATCVRPASAGGVPMLAVDGWDLEKLDFLMLDIEGYEQSALEGAVATIQRCRPVIALELKGLGQKHGWPDDMTHAWLVAQGYRQAATLGRDFIYTPC